jgi:hypothetical protein
MHPGEAAAIMDRLAGNVGGMRMIMIVVIMKMIVWMVMIVVGPTVPVMMVMMAVGARRM